MTLRHCDICGAVHDADQYEAGRGVLVVLSAQPRTAVEVMLHGQPQHDQFDICAACTRHLVAIIMRQREARA